MAQKIPQISRRHQASRRVSSQALNTVHRMYMVKRSARARGPIGPRLKETEVVWEKQKLHSSCALVLPYYRSLHVSRALAAASLGRPKECLSLSLQKFDASQIPWAKKKKKLHVIENHESPFLGWLENPAYYSYIFFHQAHNNLPTIIIRSRIFVFCASPKLIEATIIAK